MAYPFYRQEYDWDCSVACVLMLASYYHSKFFDYCAIVNRLAYSRDLNLCEIDDLGNRFGVFFTSFLVHWEQFQRKKINRPLICQIKNNDNFHFVVIYKKFYKWFLIADPVQANSKWISADKLQKIYSEVVLISAPTVPEASLQTKNKKLVYWIKISWGVFFTLFTSLIITGLTIGNQFLFKVLLDEILFQTDWKIVSNWIKAFILIFLVQQILRIMLKKMINKIDLEYKELWIRKFFQRIFFMSYSENRKVSIAWILEKVTHLHEVLNFYFPSSFIFLQNLFVCFVSLLVMIFVQPSLAIVTIFFAIFTTVLAVMVSPWKRNLTWRMRKEQEKMSATILNNLVKKTSNQRRNLGFLGWKKWNGNYQKNKLINKQKFQYEIWQSVFYQSIVFCSKLALIYLVLEQITNGEKLTGGNFIFLFFLTNNIITRSQALVGYFFQTKKVEHLRKKLDAFLPETSRKRERLQRNDKMIIEVQNLNYEYKKGKFLWTKAVNLVVEKNLCLLGKPGTGKTTLMQLIRGELQAVTGNIIWNKQKIENVDWRDWQKEICFIDVTTKLNFGTIADNILNFRHRKNWLKKWKKFKIDDWLSQLNMSSNQWIGNKDQLSNGQRQLIVFLSLIFSDCKLILIDEALNSLPSDFKMQLLQWWEKHKTKEQMIYATHDLKIQLFFEQTLVLQRKNE